MKLFADEKLDVTEELATMDQNDPHFKKVKGILGLRFNANRGQYEVQIKWMGFDYEDPTWKLFETMKEDIPERLASFLRGYPDQELAKQASQTVAKE